MFSARTSVTRSTAGTAVVLLVLVLVINCLSGFVAGRLAKK